MLIDDRSAAVEVSPPLRKARDLMPKKSRAARTNSPFAGIDCKTARGRRIADLVASYMRSIGNPTDIGRQAAVIQAAELQVIAEEARTAALAGSGITVDLDQLVRVQGAADRALRRLGIKATADTPRRSFRDKLMAGAAQ